MKLTQKTKRNIKRACIILAIALVGGVFGSMFYSAVNLGEKDVNPDNLIKVEKYDIKDGDDLGEGIVLSVKDDGTIKLNGWAKEDQDFIVDTIVLEPGTYTISGLKSEKDKVSLKVVFGANEYFAGLKNDTFVIESTKSVQIVISVAEDTICLNKTVRPVLVMGDEAGDFYK